MSKSEKEKLIITVEQAPILLDLGIDELYRDYRRFEEKYSFHGIKTKFYDEKRKVVKESIKVAMVQADPNVDTVVYKDSKGLEWKSTIVKPEPKQVLDPAELKKNIMKQAKVAAPIADKIIADSTKDVPSTSYVKVTVPEVE